MSGAGEEQELHRPVTVLRDAFGPYVELETNEGTEAFKIMAEFYIGDIHYAAMQNEAMAKEAEAEFFRVIRENGELQVESIEDDEEWEAAAEAYDDQFFAEGERP